MRLKDLRLQIRLSTLRIDLANKLIEEEKKKIKDFNHRIWCLCQKNMDKPGEPMRESAGEREDEDPPEKD